jgi:hypothetical protein
MKIRKPSPAGTVLVGVALVISLAVVPGALAKGKPPPSGGGGSTITGPVLVTDRNGDALPNWNDTVKFNVSTTVSQPYVDLKCFQNGVLVAEGSRGYFNGALDTPNFTLASPQWTSGAADCTAYLAVSGRRGMQDLASTSFHVNP